MTNPYKYRKTIEDTAFYEIQQLSGDNFEKMKYWIAQLTSLSYSMGEYDRQTILGEKVSKVLNHDE